MNKILAVWQKISKNEWFIRIVSLIIGIAIWLYIVNIADSVKEVTYSDVPITYVFEGTVPYESGLMMLVANKTFYADVKVSGARSDIMNFTKDGITATLNFNSIAAEGIYNVPINIKLSNAKLLYDIVGDDFITMEFVKSGETSLNVEYDKIGNYASGYELTSQSITPSTIKVKGPKDITDTIAKASVSPNVEGLKSGIVELDDINLYAEDGSYIDRTYLTLSATQATVALNIDYRKTVKLTYNLINSFGGNESYITTSIEPAQYIRLQGSEELLSSTQSFNLGSIDLSQLKYDGQVFNLPLRLTSDLSAVNASNSYSVTVHLNGAETKVYTMMSTSLNSCTIKNIPEGYTARIAERSKQISVRSLKYILDELKSSDFVLSIDLSEPTNEEGMYRLHVQFPEGYDGAIMQEYYVNVTIVPAVTNED